VFYILLWRLFEEPLSTSVVMILETQVDLHKFLEKDVDLQAKHVYESGCNFWIQISTNMKKQTNSVALSPRANYTDWTTAISRWNLVPTFVDRGVSCGQRGGSPTVVNLSFLDQSRQFSFKLLLIYPHKGWVGPVPESLLLRKSGSGGNRTRDLWVSSQELWPLDHRSR
jgi:hypothetical protein